MSLCFVPHVFFLCNNCVHRSHKQQHCGLHQELCWTEEGCCAQIAGASLCTPPSPMQFRGWTVLCPEALSLAGQTYPGVACLCPWPGPQWESREGLSQGLGAVRRVGAPPRHGHRNLCSQPATSFPVRLHLFRASLLWTDLLPGRRCPSLAGAPKLSSFPGVALSSHRTPWPAPILPAPEAPAKLGPHRPQVTALLTGCQLHQPELPHVALGVGSCSRPLTSSPRGATSAWNTDQKRQDHPNIWAWACTLPSSGHLGTHPTPSPPAGPSPGHPPWPQSSRPRPPSPVSPTPSTLGPGPTHTL